MNLNVIIDFDWNTEDESSPAVKKVIEKVVREEAQAFLSAIHRRLREAGITITEMKLQ